MKTASSGEGVDIELCAGVCEVLVIHPEKVARARERLPGGSLLRDVAEFFRILGDPTRIRIINTLAGDEMCVCDLCATPRYEPVGRLPSAENPETGSHGAVPQGRQGGLLQSGRRTRRRHLRIRSRPCPGAGVRAMTRKYELVNLDCAVCAAKLESELNRLDSVSLARVNFATLSLEIETSDMDGGPQAREGHRAASGSPRFPGTGPIPGRGRKGARERGEQRGAGDLQPRTARSRGLFRPHDPRNHFPARARENSVAYRGIRAFPFPVAVRRQERARVRVPEHSPGKHFRREIS